MTFISTWLLLAGFWRLFSLKDEPYEEKDAKGDAEESDPASITDDSLQQNPMVQPFGVLPFSGSPFSSSHFPSFGFPPNRFMNPKSATGLPPQTPAAPSYIYVQGFPKPEPTTSHVQSINSVGLSHVELSQGALDHSQIDQSSQAIQRLPPPYHDGLHHQ